MLNGDAGSLGDIWSHSETVTTLHPIGGREVGWDQVRGSWEQVAQVLLSRGYGREQRDESLQHGGMGEDGITQYGIRQTCEHGDLDGCDDFPCLHSESGEAKNVITLGIDEGLQKASSLGQRAGT